MIPDISGRGRVILIVLCLISLVGSSLGLYFSYKFSKQTNTFLPSITSTVPTFPESTLFQDSLYVYISGAVLKPGVYPLKNGSRLIDAIKSSGGFVDGVDLSYISKSINLAQKVKDEMSIYIPWPEESLLHLDDTNSISAITPSSASVSYIGTSDNTTSASSVNLNTASKDILMSLKGVGDVYSSKIISSRPILSYEDLVSRVKIPQSVVTYLKSCTIL